MVIWQSQHAKSYSELIACGCVPGAQHFAAFGEMLLVGPVKNHTIWPGPTLTHPVGPVGGVPMYVRSTDPADSATGLGIQAIVVYTIDKDLNAGVAEIELNGTTQVLVGNDLIFINCMHADRVGATGSAVGDIIIEDTVEFSRIPAGEVRCASSARMVPKGKRLVITDLVGGSTSGTAATSVTVKVAATEMNGRQYRNIFFPLDETALQDNSETSNPGTPLVFHEGTVILMQASMTDSKTAYVTASWAGYLENNVG